MTTWRFVLRAPPDMRLDLSPLIPDHLAGRDQAAIEAIELGTQRASRRVGDVFRAHVSATGEPGGTLHIEGGSHRFDRVGEAMSSGELTLEGDAGQYVGRRMSGGRLSIHGNTGDWAGSRLSGGTLEIGGNTGRCLGGPLSGEIAGMTGGVLIVRGNAGERAGERLRRGLVIVEGSVGAAAASRMIAGTLVVCGRCGELPGYLMRRGTLILGRPGTLLPTFVPAGAAAPAFHSLFSRALAAVSVKAAQLAIRAQGRFVGDMATLGKGEILIPDRSRP